MVLHALKLYFLNYIKYETIFMKIKIKLSDCYQYNLQLTYGGGG